MVSPFSIFSLVTISTGAIIAPAGTVERGDDLYVWICSESLGGGLDVSIGSFDTICFSSSVFSTEKGSKLKVALKSTVGIFG